LMDCEMPKSVSATGFCHKNFVQDDTVNIFLGYSDNRSASISLSWFSPLKQRLITVCGEKKMIVYDDNQEEKVKLIDKSVSYENDLFDYRTGDVFAPKIVGTEAIYNEITHFLECLLGKRCLSGIEFSEKVIKLICCAEESMKKGGVVDVC